MRNTSVLKPLAAALAALILAGCGAQPAGPAMQRHAGSARAKQVVLEAKLEGPATAKTVLSYAHSVARQLDAKARFITLTGMRIGADGAPAKRGGWTVAYVGDVVEGPPGLPSNPYNRYMRRILVTVDASGEAEVKVSEEPGMPLGLQLLEAPMPTLDSQDAIKTARRHEPSGHEGPVAKMILCAQVTPNQFQRLLWKVSTTRQSGERPVSIDADTGARVDR